MTLLLDILDWIFIFVLGLPVLYLFVFAAASTRARKDTYPPARLQRRFVTLIPAYKSDAVIVHAAQSALQQDYPQELHEVVVIADRLQPATLAELRRMPIRVLEASTPSTGRPRWSTTVPVTVAFPPFGPVPPGASSPPQATGSHPTKSANISFLTMRHISKNGHGTAASAPSPTH